MEERKVVVNGMEVIIPEKTTIREVKRVMGIPKNRALVRSGPSGSEMVRDDDLVVDGEFSDMPVFKFGR